MRRKSLAAAFLAAGVVLALAGCGRKAARAAEEKPAAGHTAEAASSAEDGVNHSTAGSGDMEEPGEQKSARLVEDHTGREVKLPAEIHRIVIVSEPLPSIYCLFDGSAEKLVGMNPSSMEAAEASILPRVAPGLLNVNTDFLQSGEIDVEELLKLNPDVVFYSADLKNHYEKLKETGIPAVGFSAGKWNYDCIAAFEGWVKLLGQALDKEDQAKGISDYGYQVYDEVQSVLDREGDLVKPRILILFDYSAGVIKAAGDKSFGQYWIDSTGGINAASELNGSPEVSMEQIYEWDPDIIYLTNFTSYQPEDLYGNGIEGNDWSSVKAVREHKVYKYPLGMYPWYPPASDTPLVLKWMAGINHPELFSDMDMEEEVRTYYKRFYRVDLTDEEIRRILNISMTENMEDEEIIEETESSSHNSGGSRSNIPGGRRPGGSGRYGGRNPRGIDRYTGPGAGKGGRAYRGRPIR